MSFENFSSAGNRSLRAGQNILKRQVNCYEKNEKISDNVGRRTYGKCYGVSEFSTYL